MTSTESSIGPNWEPTPRWERRQREVLDAAATAFAEKGYLGASTKDIADRLGVRQASLYYYFSSKEAALAAICERGVKDFIRNLHGILGSTLPISQKIRAAVANHLMPLRTRPEADYIRVFIRHRHELPDDLRHRIAGLAAEYQNLVERLFAEGIASGELRADLDPQRATLAWLGLCNSVISARRLPEGTSIDALIDDYARIFNKGVLQRRRRPASGTAPPAPKRKRSPK
jgi:AcrR family transcriptional regulator